MDCAESEKLVFKFATVCIIIVTAALVALIVQRHPFFAHVITLPMFLRR